MPVRSWSSRRCLLTLVLALTAVLSLPAGASADRAFSVRYQLNAHGTIIAAGNTLLSCSTSISSRCADVRAGVGSGSVLNNNENEMRYVDTDGVASTFTSSSATVTIPPGAGVAWAGLYWSGVDESNEKDCRGTLPEAAPLRGRAQLRYGSGPYQAVTATQVDEANSPFRGIFGAFADVTSIVRANGAGAYTVANVRALQGRYCHAGWSLAVVLTVPALPLRNLTVIDGLGTVLAGEGGEIPFTLSGFRTPPTGPVRSRLGFSGYEGDLGTAGDFAKLDGVRLANAANPVANFFNSTVSDAAGAALGTPRDPTFKNQMGFDLDSFDASAIIKNDQRSATIAFGTSGDGYHPALFTLATDIYEPDLKLEKSVAILKASAEPPGYDAVAEHTDTLQYSVRAVNTGIGAAEDVALTDAIPPGTTYVTGSLTIDGVAQTDAENDDRAEFSARAGEARFRVGDGASARRGGRLRTGAASVVGFRVTVDEDVDDGAVVPNQARALFTQETLDEPDQAFSNIVQTPVVVPDVTIAKTLTSAPLTPGAAETYALVVSNVGGAPTRGSVTVTDALPDDFDLVPAATAAGPGWVCTVAARLVTCTRADRLDRAAAWPEITITATLNAAFDGSVSNTAVVRGGGETNTTNNSDTEAENAGPQADVAVVKSAAPDRVDAGGELTFSFLAGNSGPSLARDVRLTDTIPDGLTVVAVSTGPDAACSVAGQELTCQVGTVAGTGRDLAPGQQVRFEVRVRAEAVLGGRQVTNTARVVSATPDPVAENDADDAVVTVDPVADLATSKTVAPAQPRAGGPITYTLTVLNRGPNVATGVSVVDAIVPAAVTLTGYRVTTGAATCSLEARRAICDAPSIGVGERVVIEATGTIATNAGGADLSNGVVALSDDGVTDPSGGVAGIVVDADPVADLSIVKTMAPVVVVGRETVVTLRVANAGPSPAQNVVVVDTLPAGLRPVALGGPRDGVRRVKGDGRCGGGGGQRIACSLRTLAPGASTMVRFSVRVRRSGGYRNTAVVGAATLDPVAANNRSTATTTTVTGRKRADRRDVRTGQSVRFALELRNSGTRAARRVELCDLLPRGLFAVSAPNARTRSARRVCWRVDTLAAGARRRFSLVARAAQVSRPTLVRNRLQVAGTTVASRALRVLPVVPRVTG